MRILITGAKGFVGKNLTENLKNIRDGKNRTRPALHIEEIFEYDLSSTQEELDAIWQRQKQIVLDACEEAKKDPEPLVDDLENDLYSPNMKNIEWKPFVSPAQ